MTSRTSVGLGFFLVAFAAALIFGLELRIPYYADLYWQIPEGREILAGRFPVTVPYAIDAGRWLDHEWLFEVVAAGLWSHGAYPLFAGICDLAFAATPLLFYAVVRRAGYGDAAAAFVALVGAVGIFRTNPYRPQTFAYALLAVEVAVLSGGARRPFLLLPLSALWANLHGSAVLAPAVAALFALGAAVEGVGAAPYLAAIALCALGTLATPHGVALWTYALQFETAAPFTRYIAEWRPLSLADPLACVPLAATIAVFACAGLPATRRNATRWVLATAFVILAAKHVRQSAWLMPALGPALADAFERTGASAFLARRRLVAAFEARRLPATPGLVLFAVLCLVLGAAPLRAARLAADPGARGIATLVERYGLRGRLYAPRPDAAYAFFRGYPVRLLIDSHADPYDARVWADEATLDQLRPGWLAVLQRRALDVVIAADGDALAQGLRLAPGWRLRGEAHGLDAFVRRPGTRPP